MYINRNNSVQNSQKQIKFCFQSLDLFYIIIFLNEIISKVSMSLKDSEQNLI